MLSDMENKKYLPANKEEEANLSFQGQTGISLLRTYSLPCH